MWAPNRAKPTAHRTPSVHSIASIQSASRPVSMHSPQLQQQPSSYDSDNYSELGSDDEQTFPPRTNTAPLSWSRPQNGSPAANLMAKKMESQVVAPQVANVQYQNQQTLQPRPIDDDATSRSSTLDGQEDEDTYSLKKSASQSAIKMSLTGQEPVSPAPAPHVPGPLESQLAALMSKLIHIEQANPAASVTPEEFTEMKSRLKALEDEKKVWWKRHEAIWSLRDEDVENNIKIRGMLAKARRELEETKALRDEDLNNVQIVRSKLAEKTRELERLQAQGPTGGRSSPNRPRISSIYERRDTTDLFTAAKVAALEQRALELEKRNSDLVAQLSTAQSGSIDDLNRATAHQAWKGTVADLEAKLKAKDAQIQQLRSGAGGGAAAPAAGQMDWYRIEALLEEHANYRESIGGRLQALRSEKEILMKDLHRKENECQALELKVQMLQRRANVL